MNNLPWIIRVIILGSWLFGIPTAVGGCLCGARGSWGRGGMPALWVSGQMLLWATFQLVCVPFVLLEKEFYYVVYVYGGLTAVLGVCGIVGLWRSKGGRTWKNGAQKKSQGGEDGKGIKFLAIVAGALLLFQLVQAVRLAYADGDDAYYVAVSSITNNADTMYRKLPYTGGTTEVDIRHGLAPFPIWIAFLTRVTGLKAAEIAHSGLPLALILMTYVIYFLMALELFPEKKRAQLSFLIMAQILILFGDYSFYTVEHFMLARSRQGKAALGSIVLPMMFLLMILLLKKLESGKKCGVSFWVLVAAVMISGCLCSTLGAFLLCMFMGVTGVCTAVAYRRWKFLIPMVLCCLPCVGFALIYLLV